MLSTLISAIVAILLTFWTRKLAFYLLAGRLHGPARILLGNAASFAFWAALAAFVHASNLQLVNPTAWLPYLPAQLLWLLLDLAHRRQRATR